MSTQHMGAVIVREFDELEGCDSEMDMHAFVAWLIEIDRIADITTRELDCLAWEYCLLHEMRPLTPRKQANLCAGAGLIKERPTVVTVDKDGKRRETRPTVYHVAPLVLFQYDNGRSRIAA